MGIVKKIVLFPVKVLITVLRFIIRTVLQLGAVAGVVLLLIVGIGILYYVAKMQWSQVFLMSLLGAGVLLILLCGVYLEDKLMQISESI